VSKRLARYVINDCGIRDGWPRLAQMFAFGMGAAGTTGFQGMVGLQSGVVNRFHPFGHSGFFEDEEFMAQWWLPALLNNPPTIVEAGSAPKARWFEGVLHYLDPIKILLAVAVLACGIYPLQEMRIENLLLQADQTLTADPVESFLLAHRARHIWIWPSRNLSEGRLWAAIEEMRVELNRRRAFDTSWKKGGGWGGAPVEFPQPDTSIYSLDRRQHLDIRKESPGKAYLVNPDGSRIELLGPDQALRHQAPVTGLRFSRSQKYILLARHIYFYIYDSQGRLLSDCCLGLTKDQFTYLELLHDDRTLLAAANMGQVLLFHFDPAGSNERVRQISTDEFEHQVFGDPIVSLLAHESGRRLLTVHRQGHAHLWEFAAVPPRSGMDLKRVYQFNLPARRADDEETFLPRKLEDDRFITAASMHGEPPNLQFVTIQKAGPAIQWTWAGDKAKFTRYLGHDVSAIYAGYGRDGSKIVTLAPDYSVLIWDSEPGRPPHQERRIQVQK
jgi:hypothetical protein